MKSPDDDLVRTSVMSPGTKQPEEWQQGETVTATKKAMRTKLAEGIVQFCRLCGTQIDDKAVDDLVAVLEKHS